MPANWSPTPVRPDGEYLTGANYQADRQQAANADVPQVQDDYSANVTQMQSVADPAPGGTPSLATSLAGELERLRYTTLKLKQSLRATVAQWYEPFTIDPATLPPGPAGPAGPAGATGPAGPGVAAGGATNAILSKASAADYATAWTTAPILTGLTLTGAATLANNQYVMGLDTGGASQHLISLASDNNIYIGPSLGAGRVIRLAGGGATTTVAGDATITGTLTSKHTVIAAATINGATGAVGSGYGFTTGVRSAVGTYRLTLTSAVTTAIVCANVIGAQPFMCAVQQVSTTQIDVWLYTAGALADAWFNVIVVAY
jgi:hypothetical protein